MKKYDYESSPEWKRIERDTRIALGILGSMLIFVILALLIGGLQ